MEHVEVPTVTTLDSPALEQCQRQVRRILQSAVFRNASTLQQLLRFLTARVLEKSEEPLKEYTIAVEALDRPQDFDPKADTIVRVQIYRLRQKLKEYYDSDGADDPILIDIPKGHYLPSFEAVVPGAEFNHDSGAQLDTSVLVAPSFIGRGLDNGALGASRENRRFGGLISYRAAIVAAAALVVFATGLWIGSKRSRNGSGLETASSSSELAHGNSTDPVKAFWTRFLGSDPAPIIAYPDAVFLLDETGDLFSFGLGASNDRGAPVDPHLARQFATNPSIVAKAGQLYYERGYTGTGELQAIAMLSSLFAQMGVKPTIKPSSDITRDELKQHSVILLGSSFQNLAVAHMITMGDWSFKAPDSQHAWAAQIVNPHPLANEASTYSTERDSTTRVLKTDFGLISIQPGIVSGRYIAILGGLDTTGTEGAVMFATSKPGVEQISQFLTASGKLGANGETPLFQALVRVHLEKGYQVLGADLVAVHPVPLQDARGTQTTTSLAVLH